MLLKFTYKDFLADRKNKNTTKTSIGNHERTLELFSEYCLELDVINIEDISQSRVRNVLID
jgi:integrase/recombinase XerD